MKRAGLLLMIVVGGACGSGQGDDNVPLVDAPGSDADVTDAVSDAPTCGVTIRVEPAMPLAGGDVMVYGEIEGSSGGLDWQYQLSLDGEDIPFTTSNGGRDMSFFAERAGLYAIALSAGGGNCAPFFDYISVTPPGANTDVVRLRMVPPPGSGAPPQERQVVILGGSDNPANLTLDPGTQLTVNVRTPPPDAQPVAAYLRFTSSADLMIEAFSNAAGAASPRLILDQYDVLIVPTSAGLAPRLLTDWDALTAFTMPITVDAGQELTGTVRDDAGAPIAGARVSVISAGVPSTIGTTAADGSFALRWRDSAGAETLTVVAPDASQRPRLDATLELGGRTAITVQYAAVPTGDVGGTLVSVGGTPAASTDVIVALSRPACGTVHDGANLVATATGSHRRTLRTDGAGLLPAARFVEGAGAAFVAAPGTPGATAAFPVPIGTIVDADAAVEITGQAMRSAGGGPRGGARIRATLTGVLAHTGAPSPTAIAGSDGRFSISLAAGGSYTLTVSDPSGDDAAQDVVLPAAAAADLGPITLPAAIAIRGTVTTSGSGIGLRGVGIAAFCSVECSGVERSRPLGEAVSDELGSYFVTVPDPGVTQP